MNKKNKGEKNIDLYLHEELSQYVLFLLLKICTDIIKTLYRVKDL